MDSPFADLDAWWDAASPEDGNDYTQLIEFMTAGGGYRLDFETVDDADARAQWRLMIDDVEDVVWRHQWGEPIWSSDHPLLIPYNSPYALIGFAKPFNDPLQAWGQSRRRTMRSSETGFPLSVSFARIFSTLTSANSRTDRNGFSPPMRTPWHR